MAANSHLAGGPGTNDWRFAPFSGLMKRSAFAQTRIRLAKIWRSTGMDGCRFAASTASYFDLTVPRSMQIRAMPPRPFVSSVIGVSVPELLAVKGKESCGEKAGRSRRKTTSRTTLDGEALKR